MSTTKIINVLKDDKFEEILEIFKGTPAQEVIFVLPKTSKVFSKEGDFSIIEEEAMEHGKSVSILCPNPQINELAQKHNFDVLLAREKDNSLISTVNQIESEPKPKPAKVKETPVVPAEPVMPKALEPEKDTSQIVRNANVRKSLEDVIRPEQEEIKNVPIAQKKEIESPVPVRKPIEYLPKSEDDKTEEIKSMWNFGRSSNENIWDKTPEEKKPFIPVRPKETNFRFYGKRTIGGKIILLISAVSVIVLGSVVYLSTGNAKTEITPIKQPVSFQIHVQVSDKFPERDNAFNRIPGQLFSVERVNSETFSATGKKDAIQKARGLIRIYNSYSTSPQILIATTRFESSGGLIFRTLKTVTVPGMSVKGSQVTPGSIEVDVIADKPGQEYNIQPSDFSIPAFKEKGDDEKYKKYFGKSSEPMRGGIKGEATIVSESDYSDAVNKVFQKLSSEINSSVMAQTADFIIPASASVTLKINSTARPDDATETFVITASGSAEIIGFKQNELFELLKQYVEKLNAPLTLISGKVDISYSDIKFNKTDKILELNVNVSGNAYPKFDQDKMASEMAGMGKKQVTEYLEKMEGIESARLKLSPFWVRKVPSEKDRISFIINY